MAKLNILFITQALDSRDPGRATSIRWVQVLSENENVASVRVLALRAGDYSALQNIKVIKFGTRYKVLTMLSFYMQIIRSYIDGYKIFFVHQGGTYPILLLPFRYLLGCKIYQWKAHPVINSIMSFSAKYCDNLLFTCNRESFPMDLAKRRIVGHGINVKLFHPNPTMKKYSFITTGRVSSRKNIDKMIRVISILKNDFNINVNYNIYGPTRKGDESYVHDLKKLVIDEDLKDSVFFKGAVIQSELPVILNQHHVFINLSRTALDKAVLEAMSCGVLVFSDNINVASVLPDNLNEYLSISSSASNSEIAQKLYELINLSESKSNDIRNALRHTAETGHSDITQFKMIVENIMRDSA